MIIVIERAFSNINSVTEFKDFKQIPKIAFPVKWSK